MCFKVFDFVIVQYWVNVFQVVGIGCELYNCYVIGVFGGLLVDVCMFELWFDDECDDVFVCWFFDVVLYGLLVGVVFWCCWQCGEVFEV